MIMASFPSGGCVADVVNNRTNYQFTSAIIIYFMNVLDYQKNCFECVHLFKPQLKV